MPDVSDGGRTYTYRLRHGFRFSPPSNQPVTAAAFRRAIERALDPRTNSYARALVSDIVGLRAYQAGRTRHIAGVVARGDTLTIRLTAPSPSLPARLATPYFSAVPPDTPIDSAGVEGIASAGPYYATFAGGDRSSIVLKRNPNYGGDRPQRLSEIDLGIDPQGPGVADVEQGRLDVLPIDPRVQGASRLASQYGPHSETASAGQQRYFAGLWLGVEYLALNIRHGPFSSARLRRAVNYAIDRSALARRPSAWPTFSQPTDQYVPPAMRGFRDAAIYPLDGPDVAKARRLAGNHRGHAVMYTCNLSSCLANAQVVRGNLAAIGIGVEIRQFPIDALYRKLARPKAPWDIADVGWVADYADPFGMLNLLFAPPLGRQPAGLRTSIDWGGFADPSFERRLRRAAELAGARRYRAYARLDADLARDAAPVAAYANPTNDYFFSTRMGCQVVQPVYGLDLAALCTRP
jgi:ABC-type oligopeptide transport system substrate-binding subunit